MSRRRSGEDSLIDWLRRQPATALIGDDAAVLPASGPYVVSTDTQIAGVHFPQGLDPAHVARRLLSVNLSDIAAMGAEPSHAFLVIAAPPAFDHRRFLRAFLRAAGAAGVTLAGGDLASCPHLVTTLTLHGLIRTGHRPLGRTGVRPGHRIWLGGSVGEARLGLEAMRAGTRISARGVILSPSLATPRQLAAAARAAVRRHLLPTPQIELGRWLAAETDQGGAIDLSDGLTRDLGRMCRASGVGAVIERSRIPVSASACRLAARLGIDPLDAALYGGEDYVLCFTLPPAIAPPASWECHAIGEAWDRPGLFLHHPDGEFRSLEDRGWDHLEINRDG